MEAGVGGSLAPDDETEVIVDNDWTTTVTTSPVLSTRDSEEPEPGAWTWRTEETVFNPEASRESGHLSYRHRCLSAGTFRCSSTGLVFVVTKEAELRYRIVQWDEALLRSSGRTPAGPLYDIECPERALCELHLPHCEPETADLSQSQLSVAHISDSGLSLIEPERITESHVVISVSDLSGFGLVTLYEWFFNRFRAVSGQVLLFCSPREHRTQKLKVNMFLLPKNIPVDLVERKQRFTTHFIDAPPKCHLVIDKYYSVVCPSADIVQPDRALFDMDHEPNYHPSFQLRLPPDSSTASITLREEGSPEETGVWRTQLDLSELPLSRDSSSSSSAPHRDPKTLLSSVRPDFVEKVTDSVLKQVLDRLLQEEVMSKEEVDSVKDKPRADKARSVVDAVMNKGSKAASVLIHEYCKRDPKSELCAKLRTHL